MRVAVDGGAVELARRAPGRTVVTASEPTSDGNAPAARATATPRGPDPLAWSPTAAARSAASRWSDRHPGIVRLSVVSVDRASSAGTAGSARTRSDEPAPVDLARLAASIGPAVAAADPTARRVDARLPRDHALVPALVTAGWFAGPDGPDAVVSCVLRPTWRMPDDLRPAWAGGLPAPLRRLVRRTWSTLAEGRATDLVRTAAAEVAGRVRSGRPASGPRSLPVEGAPPGSHPFGATRYRTIERSFDLVAPGLRQGAVLDVGAGDGRVLVEGRRVGFARGEGWEIDPALVRTAMDRVAPWGAVHQVDATEADVPDDVTVAFLNNPFDDEGIGRFAHRLGASLERRPRPLLVLYANPRTLAPLLAVGLVVAEANPDFTVLATSTPEAGGRP